MAGKAERVEQLRPYDQDKFRAWKIDEKNEKGHRTGVFDAESLRDLMVTFLIMLDVPPRVRPKRMRVLYEHFRLLEGPYRENNIRKIFLAEFGSKLTGRADNFVADVGATPLTTLQLRRFFRMYGTASKAKERQEELTGFPDAKVEYAWDRRRMVQTAETLNFGIERLCDIMPEQMRIWPRLDVARQHYSDLVKCQKFDAKSKQEKVLAQRIAKEMYGLLDELQQMDGAVWSIQRFYKAFKRRQVEALQRHKAVVDRIFQEYLVEKNTDFVQLEWLEERRKERIENERRQREEALAAEKAYIEASLEGILPYGWEAIWQPGEQQNQEDEGHYIYKLTKRGKVVMQTTDCPKYTYEEDRAGLKIEGAMRIFVAERQLKRLKREKKRKELEEAQKKIWIARELERKRAVTIRLTLTTVKAGSEFPSEEALEEKERLLQKALDDKVNDAMDDETELCISMPVYARYGGLEHYFPGTIYQVRGPDCRDSSDPPA